MKELEKATLNNETVYIVKKSECGKYVLVSKNTDGSKKFKVNKEELS